MSPELYGLYSIAETPEELLSRGYGATPFNEIGENYFSEQYYPAPYTGSLPFQNIYRRQSLFSDDESSGGITELDLSRFQGVSDLGRDDEDVEQVDYVQGAEPKKGLAKLLEVLGKLPTPLNLARRGIESLSKVPKSDFFQSKNLMDYLDMKKYGGAEARERAREKNLRETAAIQKQVDLRTAAGMYDVRGDRGRSVAAKEAATRSKDLQSMRGGVGR